MMTRDNPSTATVRDEDKPKAPAFHQANAADNPIDEHGKTKRDYEVEKAQKAEREKRQQTERDSRPGQIGRGTAGVGDARVGEFDTSHLDDRRSGGVIGDPQANFNKAAAALDPRNRVNEASRRPPVPGVDKERGGSSDDANGSVMGSAPDVHKHPLPNPNNPDSPNNPASTATRDMLARQTSAPLPQGARTTHETPMDGKSEAQREAERKAAEKLEDEQMERRKRENAGIGRGDE
jgi:hypothetical protein